MKKTSSQKTASGKGVPPVKKASTATTLKKNSAKHPASKKALAKKSSATKPIKPLIEKLGQKQSAKSTSSKVRMAPARNGAANTQKQKGQKKQLQHDPEYYAMIGARGGLSLAKQRGTRYYSEIARKSHPRTEYRGGRPKGSKTKKTT